jgi:hypothetical protein
MQVRTMAADPDLMAADTMIATIGARTRRAPLPELPLRRVTATGLPTTRGLVTATSRATALGLGTVMGPATVMGRATRAQAQDRGTTRTTITLTVNGIVLRPTARRTPHNNALEANLLRARSSCCYGAGHWARVAGKPGASEAVEAKCPSSDDLRPIRHFEKGSSGSSGVRV